LIGSKTGYNNQPYFTPYDQALLFVSTSGALQTDIYRYDLLKKKTKRITKTKEAEYSPRLNPQSDAISCVRVEKDSTTQHFYQYNLKSKKGTLLNNDLKTLGYYQWLNTNEIICFLVPEPFYLCKYNIQSNRCDTITTAPGRTIQQYKGRTYFVDKSDSSQYILRVLAKENLRSKNKVLVENPTVALLPSGVEDYVFLNEGILLVCDGSRLMGFNLKKHKDLKDWYEIADLSSFGIKNGMRIAASPDNTNIAIVEKLN
jgi:hypothetical protein